MTYDSTKPADDDKLNISAGLIRTNFEGLRMGGIVIAKPPYYGAGAPDDALGEPGDRYFDTDTGDHYLKNVDGQWDIKLSMADANNGNHTSAQPTKNALSNGIGYYWKDTEGLVTIEIAGYVDIMPEPPDSNEENVYTLVAHEEYRYDPDTGKIYIYNFDTDRVFIYDPGENLGYIYVLVADDGYIYDPGSDRGYIYYDSNTGRTYIYDFEAAGEYEYDPSTGEVHLYVHDIRRIYMYDSNADQMYMRDLNAGGDDLSFAGHCTLDVLPTGFYSVEGYGKYAQATVYDASGFFIASGMPMQITTDGNIDFVGNLMPGAYHIIGSISYYV